MYNVIIQKHLLVERSEFYLNNKNYFFSKALLREDLKLWLENLNIIYKCRRWNLTANDIDFFDEHGFEWELQDIVGKIKSIDFFKSSDAVLFKLTWC